MRGTIRPWLFGGFVFLALLSFAIVRGYFRWVESEPQPTLPQIDLVIATAKGPVHFTVEVATTDAERTRGLMFRKTLPPNAGMLFDFHNETGVAFSMKNTFIPLDMIFIRQDGLITAILANAKPLSIESVGPRHPVRAVLEIAGGRSRELFVRPGDYVEGAIFRNGATLSDRGPAQ